MSDGLLPDNAITELTKKLYDDVAHPGLQQVGNMVGCIMKFVALPFSFLGMTAEQLEEKYKQFITNAINKVPEENRMIPTCEKVGLLLDQAKYSFNHEELSGMFEDLLASFCDKEKENTAHPFFIHILSQIGPDEAYVLKRMSERRQQPCIDYIYNLTSHDGTGSTAVFPLTEEYFLPVDNVQEYEQIMFSLDVLKKLNIVSSHKYKKDELINAEAERIYNSLLESQYFIERKAHMEDVEIPEAEEQRHRNYTYEISCIKYHLCFTQIGADFIKCCIRDSDIFKGPTGEDAEWLKKNRTSSYVFNNCVEERGEDLCNFCNEE